MSDDIADFEAVKRREEAAREADERAAMEAVERRIRAERREDQNRHHANMRGLADAYELLEGNVADFLKDVGSSIAKAADDPSHVPHVQSVIRDAHLKVDELRAWVRRNL